MRNEMLKRIHVLCAVLVLGAISPLASATEAPGPAAARAGKSLTGPLAEHVKDGSRCNLKIVDPIRASGDLAVAFIFEHCAAAAAGEKEDDARILYVFRNGAHGYRVTMELFGWGTY